MDDQTNRLINERYRLTRLLGEGGMAQVWLARDESLGRMVALKRLRPQYAQDPSLLERFRREAQIIARLNSPYIVQIYDVGVSEDDSFIVMEYVDGEDLKNRLNSQGALPVPQALKLFRDITAGVATAHEAGLIHRDLKPANILISKLGHVKISDFGIARVAGKSGLTQPGTVWGTSDYMAPDQAMGKTPAPTMDVYSLGVLLFEMLSGTLPYPGDDAMVVMMAHIQQPVPSLISVAPSVPADLSRLVARMMAKDPAYRPQNAGELLNILDSFGSSSKPRTVPPSVAPPWSPPNPSASGQRIGGAERGGTSPTAPAGGEREGAPIDPSTGSGHRHRGTTPPPRPTNERPAPPTRHWADSSPPAPADKHAAPTRHWADSQPAPSDKHAPPTRHWADPASGRRSPTGNVAQDVAQDVAKDRNVPKRASDEATKKNLPLLFGASGVVIMLLLCLCVGYAGSESLIGSQSGGSEPSGSANAPITETPVSPTVTPTATEAPATETPTAVIQPNPTDPTETPTASATVEPYPTAAPPPTASATVEPYPAEPTETPTASATVELYPTAVPPATATIEPSPTAAPPATATIEPSPTPAPSATATIEPSPTAAPSATATIEPSPIPATPTPTEEPTAYPEPEPPIKTPVIISGPRISNGPDGYALRVPNGITLDGDLSEWNTDEPIYLERAVLGAERWQGPTDLSGIAYFAWDDEYLYLAVDRIDNEHLQTRTGHELYRDDSIELWLDVDLYGDFYVQEINRDDFQFAFSAGNFGSIPPEGVTYYPDREDRGLQVSALSLDNGYVLEARIPWSQIDVLPFEEMILGYAVVLNDNDSPQEEEPKTQVASNREEPYLQPRTFGNLILLP